MPCFTLTLFEKNKVYNLEKMITDQVGAEIDSAGKVIKVGASWPAIVVQASWDNIVNPGTSREAPAIIKYGCANLSGLRYGLQLKPGDIKEFKLGTQFVSTAGRNFLCEEIDNAQISVELVTV
jgi:hypothetical protein